MIGTKRGCFNTDKIPTEEELERLRINPKRETKTRPLAREGISRWLSNLSHLDCWGRVEFEELTENPSRDVIVA
jgi:hypothetical protein